MRRVLKYVAASLAVLVLLAGLGLAVVTRPAQHALIARLMSRLTSGELEVRDLSGNLLSAPRFGTVEIRDAQGVWAVVHDLRIDWSPWQLVHRNVRFALFSARRIDVLRRPALASSSGKSSWYGFRLDIDKLAVGRLDLAPPVIGVRADLVAGGSLHLTGPPDAGKVALVLARLDAPGKYTASADFSPVHIKAMLFANEPAGGLVAELAHVPDIGPLAAQARIAGPRSAEATSLSLRAGKLVASARGTIDLVHSAVDLDVTARAPAMAPRPAR